MGIFSMAWACCTKPGWGYLLIVSLIKMLYWQEDKNMHSSCPSDHHLIATISDKST